jgi:hypothetical protein
MAQVPVVPGKTEVQVTARGRANKIPPQLLDVPGGLYPLKSAAFEVDEYRIMSGWPIPVPDCDIQIEVLVSAEGDVLGNRDAPTALTTEAGMRWVADDSYFDQVTCEWTPIQGHVSPWVSTPDHLPTLITDFEYRFGDERFVGMTALNFDSDTADYMWNDLGLFMGGTSGYTVLMVLSPSSVYGNADVVENALWCPADLTGNWVSLTVRSQSIWMTTESKPAQQGVPITNALSSTAPTYLAMVVSRPQTTLYAASGPSKVLHRALAAGAVPVPLNTSFWLGNSPSVGASTMDMALLDLSIYGDALSRADVVNEITTLAKVYGGDDQ